MVINKEMKRAGRNRRKRWRGKKIAQTREKKKKIKRVKEEN